MESSDPSRLPKNLAEVYTYMDENSHLIDPREIFGFAARDDDSEIKIWRGFAANIASAIQTSVPMIYKIQTTLQSLNCITKIRNGANNSPTVFQLHFPPNPNYYATFTERSSVFGRTKPPSPFDKLNDRVTRLTEEIQMLKNRLDILESKNNGRSAKEG